MLPLINEERPLLAEVKKIVLKIYQSKHPNAAFPLRLQDAVVLLSPVDYRGNYLSFIVTIQNVDSPTYFFKIIYDKGFQTFLVESFRPDCQLTVEREDLKIIRNISVDSPIDLCYNWFKFKKERMVLWTKQKLSCLFKKFKRAF